MGHFKNEITVEATLDNLDTVTGFIEETLSEAGCPMKLLMKILVSFEEVYVNVANYAYGDGQGDCNVSLEIHTDEGGGNVKLTVKDKGIPFNPLEREEPDITLSAEDRPIGGLGIFMVKKSMDKVEYEYLSGENILTMEKLW